MERLFQLDAPFRFAGCFCVTTSRPTRRLHCQPLESRQLMAGDIPLACGVAEPVIYGPIQVDPIQMGPIQVDTVDFNALQEDSDDSQTIDSVAYQDLMGIGFATSWFKSTKMTTELSDVQIRQTMVDLREAGFSNLRMRSRADLFGFADIKVAPEDVIEGVDYVTVGDDKYEAAKQFEPESFGAYKDEMNRVLDIAFEEGMMVTISWIHHNTEGRADTQDALNFQRWWRKVAKFTKDRGPELSYNLMTEVGKQDSNNNGDFGVFSSVEKFNQWTRSAIDEIRASGGNNATRNIIISTPRNTKADALLEIDPGILAEDQIMVEYHAYAAGASSTGRNEWNGTGSEADRARLTDRLDGLDLFHQSFETDDHKIPIYWGAWMPMDNKTGTLSQAETEAFGEFFASELAKKGIPWSLNHLGNYYDVEENQWLTTKTFGGGDSINVEKALASVVLGHESQESHVESIDINDGDAQRSGIDSLRVTFESVVTIDEVSGEAFQIRNTSTDDAVSFEKVVKEVDGKTVVDFSFSSDAPSVNPGGGLLDGDYELSIDASLVTGGQDTLASQHDEVAGNQHVFGAIDGFYRKYGDQDGDGSVGLSDFAQFRSAFGTSSGDSNYLKGLDAESDGVIGLADFAQFRQNFGG